MFRSLAPRWLRYGLVGCGIKQESRRRLRQARKLTLETLEQRLAPATLTWVGDVDANWNTNNAGNTNWSGDVLPASGDTLRFDGTGTGLNLNNNTAAGNSYVLQFTAGGYVITGNSIALDLAGTDVSSSTGQILVLTPAVFAAGTTVDITGGQLQLAGPVTGPAGGLTKLGTGLLSIAGTATYQQATDVQAGGLLVGGGGSITSPGTVTLQGTALLAAPNGETGSINARINGTVGTTIEADQNSTLTLGDATSTAGFATAGLVNVLDGATMTLLDADAAQLVLTRLNGSNARLVVPNGIVSGGPLVGTGTVQTTVATFRDISPDGLGSGLGQIGALAVVGDLTLTNTSTYQADLNDASPGQFDTLAVTGSTSLGNAALFLQGSLTPALGQQFTILTTTAGITGRFTVAGTVVDEGAIFPFHGGFLKISYAGGNVSLTVVPNPNPVINAGPGDNQIVARRTAGGDLQVDVDGVTVLDSPLAGLNSLTINGQGGDDRLTIDTSNGNPVPPGGLAFNGGSGHDQLNLLTSATQTFTLTGPGSADGFAGSNAGNVSFDNVDAIDPGAGVFNRLRGTNLHAFWDISGHDAGQYRVGANSLDFTHFAFLTGGSGLDEFTVVGSGDVSGGIDGGSGPGVCDSLAGRDVPNTWRITNTDIGFLNTLPFSGIETLVGGSSTDRFVFERTSFVTGRLDCDVDGGGGVDTIDYTLLDPSHRQDVTLTAPGFVDGFDGNDGNDRIGGSFFNIDAILAIPGSHLTGTDDAAGWFITGVNEGIYVSSSQTLHFTGFANLTGGSGEDGFVFEDTGFLPALVTGNIDGGSPIAGATDCLDYSQIAGPIRTSLSAATSTRIRGTFSDINCLIGSDTPGECDELVGENNANLWTIDGHNSGAVDGFRFIGIESLTGGKGDDRFAFVDTAVTQGRIDCDLNGGFGTDTIDYTGVDTAANGPTMTDLSTGLTSRVGGFFTNLEGLDGSADQTLVAMDMPNLWLINQADGGKVNGFRFTRVKNPTGGTDRDRFELLAGGSVSGTLDGNTGADTLVGYDTANAWGITGANAGNLNFGNLAAFVNAFRNVESLVGGALADTFTFTAAASSVGSVDGGLGTDTLAYPGRATAVTTDLQAGKAIEGGTAFTSFANMDAVVGKAGRSDVLIGQDNANLWTIDAADGGDVDGFMFADAPNLTGGAAADRFVLAAAGGSVSGTIDGSAGADTLAGYDTANAWTIDRANGGKLNSAPGSYVNAFRNVESLVGGALADTFTFSNPASSIGSVDGGLGVDKLAYPGRAAAVTTDLQAGLVREGVATVAAFANVEGVAGKAGRSDVLIGQDNANLWTIDAADGGNVDGFAFTDVPNLLGGIDRDRFRLLAGGSVSGRIVGGDGSAADVNTLVGYDQVNAWSITRADGGSLNGSTGAFVSNFDDVQNLVGGALGDTFAFAAVPAAGVSGNVDGGPGMNTLDYTALSTPIDTNLQTAKSSRIGGTFRNIGVLKGGTSRADKLTGMDAPNTWELTGQFQGAVGHLTFQGVENLTGGNDRDVFEFLAIVRAPNALFLNLDGGPIPTSGPEAGRNDNWLDYHHLSIFVSVVLNQPAQNATLAASVTRVDNVLGSADGGDRLIGNGNPTSW